MGSNFSSSQLVRLLGEWAPVDAATSGMDFAERLSLSLNTFDAIEMQAAQQSIRAMASIAARTAADGRKPRAASLAEDLQRVRSALSHAIAQQVLPLPSAKRAASALRRDNLAAAGAAPPETEEPAFAPYHQRHLELQRQMEQMIAPLRDHVRQALGQASPRLRQLAALDALMERVLAPRQQALLPTAAALMERRFEQLHRPHREAPGSPQAAGWLDSFEKDWRQALLAELDLRLEPVAGLIDASSNELKNRP